MRLIDADEAIKRAKEEPSIYDLVDTPEFLSYCPTVNLAGQWISVKDRLPESSGSYIVYSGKSGTVFTAHFWARDNRWSGRSLNLTITHWMPLPEPPETPETEAENDCTV